MEITELQKDLAATFRWTARLNMNEAVANHFSACIPGSTTDFYVNRSGVHFSQMKASDLILVTKDKITAIITSYIGSALGKQKFHKHTRKNHNIYETIFLSIL